jgi:hypothetical protein
MAETFFQAAEGVEKDKPECHSMDQDLMHLHHPLIQLDLSQIHLDDVEIHQAQV